jgi:hypothetical protein
VFGDVPFVLEVFEERINVLLHRSSSDTPSAAYRFGA